MAKARKNIKKRDHEKLTDSNIKHVISLLESDNPITKKEACAILNISYNTARLNTIIEDFKDRKETEAKRKAERKGKAASKGEISTVLQAYIEGEPISDIAKRIYRSTSFVKNIIARIGVPQKVTGDDKFKVGILPEQCISEDFSVGEVAWSASYHSPCIIRAELDPEKYKEKYGTRCYRIYIPESMEEFSQYFPQVMAGGFNAYAASYDLGKLEHLEEYGVKTSSI